jgi:hypothetical protein
MIFAPRFIFRFLILLVLPQTISFGEESQSASLQIINGTDKSVEIYWIKSDSERISNGSVEPGKNRSITTTLGHRFEVVSSIDQLTEVITSQVPNQAFRVGGVPDFYTQRIEANGFPIVASASVNPYALKEAAAIIDGMLGQRPDVREAMIKSGSRLCILACGEFTTEQPEWQWLANQKRKEFPGVSAKDFYDARARGMGGSQTDPFCSCGEENLLAYPGDPYSTESMNLLITSICGGWSMSTVASTAGFEPPMSRPKRQSFGRGNTPVSTITNTLPKECSRGLITIVKTTMTTIMSTLAVN